MEHEHDVVRIEQVHDLEPPAGGRRAPDEQLVIRPVLRIRRAGVFDDVLGLAFGDAVAGELAAVPRVPAEFQARSPIIIYIKT